MNYLLLYFFALFFTISIIGHGFLLSKTINKDLLKLNIGYQGLLGILSLTIISYFTIFFLKHGYVHNIILHAAGIISFTLFFKKNIKVPDLIKLTSIFTILFIGLLIIRNHDDFNYYHLTYSLGLTENKIFLGLGQFQHGYKHHSSLFFFNSIIFLPFIKHYLFHSLGWFTLVFVNFYIIDYLIFKKKKELNFEYFFYLLTLLFINVKFYRIGSYGTDISGQIILLSIFPLIFSTLKLKINDTDFKSNIWLIILLVSYVTTLKSFFILNIIFLFSFLMFFNFKKIMSFFIQSKTFLVVSTTILLLTIINISYTGCAIYPVKETCLSNQLSWSLEKDYVDNANNWYQQWSKAGAGPNYRVKNPDEYIKKFNWVSNWHERYFKYKGYETILGIIFLLLLILFLFRGVSKEKPDKQNKKKILTLFATTLILSFEWFYNHPAFRYGGYYLLCIIFFVPISYYLSTLKLNFFKKKNTIFYLIIFSFLIFEIKNIKRIKEEFKIIPDNNFPLFYAPTQLSKEIALDYNVKVYKPLDNQGGCWVAKTPCVMSADHVVVNKKLGFYMFVRKK